MTAIFESPAAVAVAPPRRSRWIDEWRPEDRQFFDTIGAPIAHRNLVFSILSEHVGFCIWSMWSAFVLFLGPDYGFDPAQKFLLTTVPTLVGALIRIPYTFAVAKFGGRNWTIFSSALLLVPCLATALVLEPGVSFGTLLAVAALAGVGGGNFSSSMSNIDSFYPQRLKGWALGLNAGGGNVGVAAVQLVGLAVFATAGAAHPRLILAVYLPLIVVSTACAAQYMDNLSTARNEPGAMREVARDRHAWVIAVLYIGTFGSFIGFGFAFGQVLQIQFADTFDTPTRVASVTFLGPLLGSLFRPAGGALADRLGGSRVSAWTFTGLAVSASVVLAASMAGSLPLFVVGFVALFILAGVGNGSTYKMIPAIFRSKADDGIAAGVDPADADRRARRQSRALIGIAGAIGALGGVGVNLALRQSFLSNGSADAAYVAFIAYFVVCLVLTLAVFRRPSASVRGV
jgi:MFS transporter, NNP family, nitrate/nitrite transporter